MTKQTRNKCLHCLLLQNNCHPFKTHHMQMKNDWFLWIDSWWKVASTNFDFPFSEKCSLHHLDLQMWDIAVFLKVQWETLAKNLSQAPNWVMIWLSPENDHANTRRMHQSLFDTCCVSSTKDEQIKFWLETVQMLVFVCIAILSMCANHNLNRLITMVSKVFHCLLKLHKLAVAALWMPQNFGVLLLTKLTYCTNACCGIWNVCCLLLSKLAVPAFSFHPFWPCFLVQNNELWFTRKRNQKQWWSSKIVCAEFCANYAIFKTISSFKNANFVASNILDFVFVPCLDFESSSNHFPFQFFQF